MGKTCRMHDGNTKLILHFGHKISRQGPLGYLRAGGRKTLNLILGGTCVKVWTEVTLNKDQMRTFVNVMMNVPVPYKQGTFLTAEKQTDFLWRHSTTALIYSFVCYGSCVIKWFSQEVTRQACHCLALKCTSFQAVSQAVCFSCWGSATVTGNCDHGSDSQFFRPPPKKAFYKPGALRYGEIPLDVPLN
jgi:hypothetical protein